MTSRLPPSVSLVIPHPSQPVSPAKSDAQRRLAWAWALFSFCWLTPPFRNVKRFQATSDALVSKPRREGPFRILLAKLSPIDLSSIASLIVGLAIAGSASAVGPGISVGLVHSLALKSDGTVWAWGNGYYGQLGNGAYQHSSVPVQVTGPDFPESTVAVVAAGYHSMALTNDGVVWGWGWNEHGQFADGSRWNSSNVPKKVAGLEGTGALDGVVAIAGSSEGGGHSLALKNDGTAVAWGHGFHGELGNNSNVDLLTPVQVVGPDGARLLTGIAAIAAGDHFSLALRGTDGSVWAWGYGNNGALGNGSAADSPVPVQVSDTCGAGRLGPVTAIAAGADHALALRADGTVCAWGNNADGALGNNGTWPSRTPVPVVGPGGEGVLAEVAAIAAGGTVSVAVKRDGTVWAWGSGSYGALGNGTTTAYSRVPVQVAGPGGIGHLDSVLAVAANRHHVAVIRTDTGDTTVWDWGQGTYGALGNNGTANSLVPVQVVGPGAQGFLNLGVGTANASGGIFADPRQTAGLNSLADTPLPSPAPTLFPEPSIPPTDSRERNVVLLVHGWNSNKRAWAEDTAKVVVQRIGEHRLCSQTTLANSNSCWDVWAVDWSEEAKARFDSQVVMSPLCWVLDPTCIAKYSLLYGVDATYNFSPLHAFNKAFETGAALAQQLGRYGSRLGHVHLIAHSAGSNAIQAAAEKLEQNRRLGLTAPRSLQLTFLDPYTPGGTLGVHRYGNVDSKVLPTYSENYVSRNVPTTLPDLVASFPTAQNLTNAYNFDVSLLDKSNAGLSIVEDHAWPYQFYQCSVSTGAAVFRGMNGDGEVVEEPCPTDHGAYGFGFPLTAESGWTIDALRGSYRPGRVCTATSSTICMDFAEGAKKAVSDAVSAVVDGVSTTVSATGKAVVWIDGTVHNLRSEVANELGSFILSRSIKLVLSSGSPVWVRMPVTIDKPANYFRFDFAFKEAGRGYLQSFIHGKQTYSADQQYFTANTVWKAPQIGLGELGPGTYEIAFRLDPFSDTQSVVEISNIEIGWVESVLVSNQPPVANAGADLTAESTSLGSAVVQLNGSSSTDSDGDPLTFTWTGPFGTMAGPTPTVTLPLGDNVITLTVSDGKGGSAMATVTITVVDTIRPVVTFSGNEGSYTVDQTVAITCAATDSGSGVASTTCNNVSAPAYSFPLGTNTLSATATDKAGNVGTGSTTFTVNVTFESLINLTKRFVTKPLVKATLVGELKLAAAAQARGELKVKAKLIELYIAELKAVTGKAITAENAAILTKLAQAL